MARRGQRQRLFRAGPIQIKRDSMKTSIFRTLLFAAAAAAFAQQPTITPTAKALNKSFDADASQWTERFEHEGRAIYDIRAEILDARKLKLGMNVAGIGAGSGLMSRVIEQSDGVKGT